MPGQSVENLILGAKLEVARELLLWDAAFKVEENTGVPAEETKQKLQALLGGGDPCPERR